MSYRYEEKAETSDVLFTAVAETLEELFTSCWDAAVNATVENIDSVDAQEKRDIQLEDEELDFLLYDFLGEFIFEKDTEGMIFRIESVKIQHDEERWSLTGRIYGEPLDEEKHGVGLDIKAVTFHEFELHQDAGGIWHARVLLDV